MTEISSAPNRAHHALRTYLATSSSPLISRGIEKEGLRVHPDGKISQTDHPSALGQPLTHANITTDYSEALLELITPVEQSAEALLNNLEKTHVYVHDQMADELFWAGSMPCALAGNDSIRIAEYGDSNIGKLKHVYRKGLDVRYGRIMQSIAGLHFNFSLSDDFWQQLKESEGVTTDLKTYKSEKYFALTRNFRRYSWLLMYLFGASPALDASFLDGKEHDLEQFDDKGTLYKPYACSLRMSDFGYSNNAQSSLSICFNTLDNFTKTLGEAIHSSYPKYEEIGVKDSAGDFIQLNTNVLQIENEYYSSLRPKRTAQSGERPTEALIARGVEYVEVRCLDLNPYFPLGIDAEQIAFMDAFLLHCLLEDSPTLSTEACAELEKNFDKVAMVGRRPGLALSENDQTRTLEAWSKTLLSEINQVARLLDDAEDTQKHQQAVASQLDKVVDTSLCPSTKILDDMRSNGQSWLALCSNLSRAHKQSLLEHPDKYSIRAAYQEKAQQSLDDADNIAAADDIPFETFLNNFVNA